MLETLDLSRKISRSEYQTTISELELTLGDLQRQAKRLKIPILIVFEGWGASGKGTLTNKLLLALDPRDFNVYPIHPPNEEERYRPFLWRFWIKTPEAGRMAIFTRSWYSRFLVEKMDNLIPKESWQRAYSEVCSFEKQLVDNGGVIVKFFLHISQAEQKKRFKKLQKNPASAWRVTDHDWKKHKEYDIYLAATEEMLARTHTPFSPWTTVEAQDWRYATVKIFKTVIAAIENKIQERKSRAGQASETGVLDPVPATLDKTDLSLSLEPDEYKKDLKKYQRRIQELEYEAYRRRLPVVIVYEGWDAAGKGGSIRRLVQRMDPRGYEVINISAPNDIEKSHHYLWRFWMKMPKAGHMAIFDRSWYGRVLVERVEGFCSEADWKRAYGEINEMETHMVNSGVALIKFWMDIDKDEQLLRLKSRQKTPHKQWKITDEDWRNRDKWEAYQMAVDEMVHRTHTPAAPWTLVEANNKRYARVKVLKTVCHVLEKHLKSG